MFETIALVFSVVIDENAKRIRNCHFKMRNAKYCHYSIDSPISFQYNSDSGKIEKTLEFLLKLKSKTWIKQFRIFFFGTATATATATLETTKVNVCSSTESYTLSPWLAYVGDDVTTTGVSYNLWNAYGKTWTEMSHWDDSKGCFIPMKTLSDGSGLQCSYDGKLIVERSKGWPPGTCVRYWVQSALSNGSYDHHFYEVKFIHCKYGFYLLINTPLREEEEKKRKKNSIAFHLEAPVAYAASIRMTCHEQFFGRNVFNLHDCYGQSVFLCTFVCKFRVQIKKTI